MMNICDDFWNKAVNDLGIRVEFDVQIPEIEGIASIEALIVDFGAEKGMLVSREYDVLKPYVAEILKLGYGYSIMECNEVYEKNSAIEILRDWKWVGTGRPPIWY